eukprot:2423197-Pleurochrysis_carterae.AAC.1
MSVMRSGLGSRRDRSKRVKEIRFWVTHTDKRTRMLSRTCMRGYASTCALLHAKMTEFRGVASKSRQ